jgi:beta-1,4-mannosyl-glycoprotein beta-1,4-N-acetylglucosaminyltransferase|tara:strand:+ start:197 stop:994 length:798 start_codon:yes stop_codon:yes gene_type:complete
MAIYDCFQYFNEDHVVDLRFNILDKYVDYFVVSESTRNHQGENKKLNFNVNRFSKFKKKIIYLVANPGEDLIRKKHKYGHSLIEQHQRNYLINGLNKADNNDLILVSDSDEIPDLRKLSLIKKKFFAFSQKAFCYKLNLQNPREDNWIGTRGCVKKNLISTQDLRNIKFKHYPFWRLDKKNTQIINEGGWHFSYLLDLKKISEKIKSFSHSEANTKENTEIGNLQIKLDLLIHPTNNYKLKKINIDKSFPDYILNNTASFDKWIA